MSERWSWARRPGFWTAAFLVLGLGLRANHYIRDPSVWHDEAALVVNVLVKGFRELLGPLLFAEAAPPLFLWLERAICLVLGDSTFALRLLPFLASCGALIWLVPIARRMLVPSAVPWAILLFATSDRLSWHACEAKPYALDVFAAVAVVGTYRGSQTWALRWRLTAYTLLAPVVIFLSYPGCFLFGGVLVVLLWHVWRERKLGAWLGYGVLVLVVFGAFALLALGPVRAQRCDDMASCWEHQFPRWDQPSGVPGWMLFSTLDVFRYCFKPIGQALALFAAVGGVLLWRSGQRALVVLLTLPLGLALLAACLHAYPYGGARVEVYAAPALALLIAAGIPPVFAWIQARAATRRLPMLALARSVAAVLLLTPLGIALYRAVVPWERPDCARAAAYVLAHHEPGDEITTNHWVYPYYFRHIEPALRLTGEWRLGSSNRQWVVVTAEDLADRRGLIECLPLANWRILDRREFTLTSVLLLGRK